MKNGKAVLRGALGLLLMLVLGAMYAWSYFRVALERSIPPGAKLRSR